MYLWSSLFFPSKPSCSVPLETRLQGKRLYLRMGDARDWKEWRALRETSRDYLVPWEPEWPADALSYHFYCAMMRRHWRDWRYGRAFAFSIFLKQGETDRLIGSITLGDVLYSASQKGTVGYWIGQIYAGRGYMTEALQLVCDFGFHILNLQRIEASCMPGNEASKKVLRRAGFVEEGFAKAYLQINGRREDHILWGRGRGYSPSA